MKHKNLLQALFPAAGMLILILDGKTALMGASEGISLCLRTIIPSLFPFFVLSVYLTDALNGISSLLITPLTRLFRVPRGTEGILLSGFLGGYPVGAQCIYAAYRSGQIDKANAQRMLSFCNNAGPAFLFGMISPLFPDAHYAWILWVIHIFSAFLVSCCLPDKADQCQCTPRSASISLSQALHTALSVTASVCGWVILFRVILTFFQRWFLWLLPIWLQVLCCGMLELSNGCCQLDAIAAVPLRALICSVMLALGGFCVTMQTGSVAADLSINYYLTGKILQAIFSILLSLAFFCGLPFPAIGVLTAILLFRRKKQKKDSIPQAVGV